MKVTFDITKSLWENVESLHERLKKLKKKRERLIKLIEEEEKKNSEKQTDREVTVLTKKRKRQWYEAFRWMFTSKGKLVIGGKDARTNEIIVRKYLEPRDLFFHADIVGAPSVILKRGKEADEDEIRETAIFAASYSRAWKMGLSSVDVYYVNSDQVSLSPPSGEYRPKGGVIVKGKRNYIKVPLLLYVNFDGEKFYVSVYRTENSIAKLVPGKKEKGELADKIIKKVNADRFLKNQLMEILPSGGEIEWVQGG